MAIKIENANVGDKVMTHDGLIGEIFSFHVSDANRIYADIETDSGDIISRPISMCNKL